MKAQADLVGDPWTILLEGLSGLHVPIQFAGNVGNAASACETANAGLARDAANAPVASNQSDRTRPILTPEVLMLPGQAADVQPAMDHTRTHNLTCASIAHAAAHLLFSQPGRTITGLKPMGVAVVSAIEDARVERMLILKYPGVQRWFAQELQQTNTEGLSTFALLLVKLSRSLLDDYCIEQDYWVSKAHRLFQMNVQRNGLADYDGFRAIASILANDLGQMRVQFNAQQFVVPHAYRDDNSYLWNFKEDAASEDLTLENELMAASEPPSDSDAHPQTQSRYLDASERFIYPEWNSRVDLMRQDWSTVIEYAVRPLLANTPVSQRIQTARACRTRVLYARSVGDARIFRQREGDAFDMSAMIDGAIHRRMETASDGRYYIRRQMRLKKCSILLLLDLSVSVTARIHNSEYSILDIEKRAAIMFAHLALEVQDRVAIHGFCSDTRHGVHYYRFLDFGRSFSPQALAQLQEAPGQYSTRMGAAIRHAQRFFENEDSDQQAVIMMTDGAPSDIDVFDPDYLIQDAARAVKDARRLEVYGLVMDPAARDYANTIFGSGRYRIVPQATMLAGQLQSLYTQLRTHTILVRSLQARN
jgi:Mg-chelatase subunit ChlD